MLSLPLEIFDLIIRHVTDKTTLSRLSRTCKTFQALLFPRLYSRVSVDVAYHSDIAKFIRNIEPHLSIRQRKQLKKEGKYSGQQDEYPSNLGPEEKPACAEHVRQLSVSHLNPDRKNAQILYRYIEEALQNMRNIEVLEFETINEEIAEATSGLEKLQALSICPNYEAEVFSKAEYDSLKRIKNLKHLALGGDDQLCTLQTILPNSASTLKSLDLNPSCPDFWKRLEQAFEAGGRRANRKHYLPALRSFTLSGPWFPPAWITPESIRSLGRVIDFARLRELTINYFPDEVNLLYDHLANLYSATDSKGIGSSLRKLTMDMSFLDHTDSFDEEEKIIDSQIRFLSSFSTLTSLHLKEFSRCSTELADTPSDLPDAMIQAILKHKNLDSLGICVGGIGGCGELPHLAAGPVANLVDGLPKLTLLEMTPDEDNTTALGQALSRGTNLESIVFSGTFISQVLNHADGQGVPNMCLLEDLLKANLTGGDTTKALKYKWEDHCKLKSVTIDEIEFQIASKFEGGGRDVAKPKKVSLGSNPAREVLYRDGTNVEPPLPCQGFGGHNQWVDKVCGN
ncbi:hypothetical protein FAVG1_10923 [Fusarium avenaceum]|nr:hypothetical protein FAVG1_10923 [Fusarium avenaceum]